MADRITPSHGQKSDLVEDILLSCSPHNNPVNYIDEPAFDRPGWIRTTCKICACFVGYRQIKKEVKPDDVTRQLQLELKC